MLSGGQVHDSKVAVQLLSGVNITKSNIIGDKAYGTVAIRNYITEQDAQYTIPPRENNPNPWHCDFWLYKERHLVECFFNKIKEHPIKVIKLILSMAHFQRGGKISLRYTLCYLSHMSHRLFISFANICGCK